MKEKELLKKHGPLVRREFGKNPRILRFTRHLRPVKRLLVKLSLYEENEQEARYREFLAEVAKGRLPSMIIADRTERAVGTTGGW
jgi:hypothetical protein